MLGCINKDTLSLSIERTKQHHITQTSTIMTTQKFETRPANATEILNQLGGRRFIVMTGTKQFIDMGDGLKMKLTRNKLGAQFLYIQLLADDTYLMTFAKIVKFDWVVIEQIPGVYFDQLQTIFTEKTGLYTHL